MLLLLPLLGVFLFLHLPGLRTIRTWPDASDKAAIAMGISFVSAGILHFVNPDFFVSMIPEAVPSKPLVVALTGGFEILGGLSLMLLPGQRPWIALVLMLFLLAVLPANVRVALHGSVVGTVEMSPVRAWLRIPVQLIFIGFTGWAGRRKPQAGSSSTNDTYAPFKGKLFFTDYFNAFGFRHATRDILHILKDRECRTVLEVCCGTGMLSQAMTRQGISVTGVDMSETMLERARRKKRADRLLLMDATRMEFRGEFDAALIQIALHEMPPDVRIRVLERMKEAVKPDGILIFSDFTPTSNRSIGARINGHLIKTAEEAFLDTYPDHHRNYLEWMEGGGLKGFLKNEEILSENTFMGGHLGVTTIANRR